MVRYFASLPLNETLTIQVVNQMIKSLPAKQRQACEKLSKSLQAKENLTEFFDAMEEICGPELCDVPLKALDKKTK